MKKEKRIKNKRVFSFPKRFLEERGRFKEKEKEKKQKAGEEWKRKRKEM